MLSQANSLPLLDSTFGSFPAGTRPWQIAQGMASPRRCAWKLARLVFPVMCKLALLLAMVQTPTEASGSDAAESSKTVAEECLLVVSPTDTRCRNGALERRCVSHIASRAPVATAQRLAESDCSHGHILANGLRAPLRC
ncbi:MAG: hypothetical protein KF708_21440 [Pirellulales bacterium]|nr:hypothetical protein [Pirellulales bacterium]